MLIPLQALVKLDMGDVRLSPDENPQAGLASGLALPHLRELRISTPSSPFRRINPPVLLSVLVKGTTAGLRTLDLFQSANMAVTPFVDTLIPYLSSLTNFIWIPPHPLVDDSNRASTLALIGSMISVKNMYLSMWVGDGPPRHLDLDLEPIDPAVFDPLATLPSLRTLHLLVGVGVLDDKPVIPFLSKAQPALRRVKVDENTRRHRTPWTEEQRARVEAAGEDAGVTFEYNSFDF